MLTAVGFGTLIEQVFGNTEHDSVHDATSSGLGSLVAIQLTHATTREFHAHVADRQLINELPRDRGSDCRCDGAIDELQCSQNC